MSRELTREQLEMIERFNADVPVSVIVATTRALRDAERLDAIAWGMGFESAVRSREDAA